MFAFSDPSSLLRCLHAFSINDSLCGQEESEDPRVDPVSPAAASCSLTQSCLTLCDHTDHRVPGSLASSLPVCSNSSPLSRTPASHLILCRPLLPLPSIFPSIRVFSSESVLSIRWPKYWSFSFSVSPSNEYSGLISFRIDWLDLLEVQGTFKSLLQHHSSKALIVPQLVLIMKARLPGS